EALMAEPFFVPEGTSVHGLLVQFHRTEQRTAFVVDEYGDIQGMVTIEDILEEILGGFSANAEATEADVRKDGSAEAWLVNAGINVRALNRLMHWHLPTDGPITLNGLILEQLETIPERGAVLLLNGYQVEILATGDNVISAVRIKPPAPAASA
ncbi:MAG: transporter associated domain-containing protein, partial [Gammaproteobacteria bacterium]